MRYYDSPYLVYHEKVKTSRVFIRDCSMVSVYSLLLFGGGRVNVELHKGDYLISLDDGWIRFAAASYQVGGWAGPTACACLVCDWLLGDVGGGAMCWFVCE